MTDIKQAVLLDDITVKPTLSRQNWELIMSTHLGRVFTYPYFILYAVSKWDQASDIHLTYI